MSRITPSGAVSKPAVKPRARNHTAFTIALMKHFPNSKPLSEMEMDIPMLDIEAYVNRTTETRQEELNSEYNMNRRNGAIPRPLNAFMLYRKVYQPHARAVISHAGMSAVHQKVSSLVGYSWTMENDEVKDKFSALSVTEKSLHALAFPDYKYLPSKPRAKPSKELPDDEANDRFFLTKQARLELFEQLQSSESSKSPEIDPVSRELQDAQEEMRDLQNQYGKLQNRIVSLQQTQTQTLPPQNTGADLSLYPQGYLNPFASSLNAATMPALMPSVPYPPDMSSLATIPQILPSQRIAMWDDGSQSLYPYLAKLQYEDPQYYNTFPGICATSCYPYMPDNAFQPSLPILDTPFQASPPFYPEFEAEERGEYLVVPDGIIAPKPLVVNQPAMPFDPCPVDPNLICYDTRARGADLEGRFDALGTGQDVGDAALAYPEHLLH